MRGERTVAQEALFEESSIARATPRRTSSSVYPTTSSICLVFGFTCALSTAR